MHSRRPDTPDGPVEELGRLKVVEFEDPTVLTKEGQQLFRAPEDVLNRILWRAMKGSRAPYPEWAVTPVEDDDDELELGDRR